MRKNVASQVIGAQMVSATDGSAFTSAVSVAVTIDGGTQGAGGGTAPAHEGNGFHSYTPTQAETNGDHIAFTFTGTGAIPVTVQVYTGFPQTGDSFARLGAPAGASVSADIAAIEAQTDDIGAAGAGLTALATAAALTTVDTVVDAIKAKTDSLTFTVANQVDANALSISGAAPETSATIADAVWDEATAGHTTAGTTGKALTDAGSAGDPWSTALPGAYGAGTAGKIIGDNVNATVSSRATQTSVDAIDTNVDSILVDTAVIGTPAGASVSADVAAVKAQTAAIETDTQDIQAKIGTTAGVSVSADIAAVKAETAAILTDTAEIGAAGAGLTALASAAALATVDTVVDAILVDTGTTLQAEHDATQALIAGLNDLTVAEILAGTVEGTLTVNQFMMAAMAVLAGKVSGAGTGTEVFRNYADTLARVTVTADVDGNRTAVTFNFT